MVRFVWNTGSQYCVLISYNSRLFPFVGFTKGSIPKAQRTGAIIILSMLAKARPEIMSEKVHLLLRIGLGQLGKVKEQSQGTWQDIEKKTI